MRLPYWPCWPCWYCWNQDAHASLIAVHPAVLSMLSIVGSFVACSLTSGSDRSEEEVRGTRGLVTEVRRNSGVRARVSCPFCSLGFQSLPTKVPFATNPNVCVYSKRLRTPPAQRVLASRCTANVRPSLFMFFIEQHRVVCTQSA